MKRLVLVRRETPTRGGQPLAFLAGLVLALLLGAEGQRILNVVIGLTLSPGGGDAGANERLEVGGGVG